MEWIDKCKLKKLLLKDVSEIQITKSKTLYNKPYIDVVVLYVDATKKEVGYTYDISESKEIHNLFKSELSKEGYRYITTSDGIEIIGRSGKYGEQNIDTRK